MSETTLKATQVSVEEHSHLKKKGLLGRGMAVMGKPFRKRPDAPQEPASGKNGSSGREATNGHFRLSKSLLESASKEGGEWIVDSVERVRLRRAALAVQANPLAFKERQPVFPTAPTPQQRSKMANGVELTTVIPGAGPVAPLRAHRAKLPIESVERHLTEEEKNIYRAFTHDAELAIRCNLSRTTSSYDGVASGAKGPRSGGVPDKFRDAYATFNTVWSQLEPRHRIVAYRMVLGLKEEAHAADMTPAQFGKLASKFTDDQTAKGVTVGLIKGTLWQIHHLYRIERAKTAARSSPEEVEKRRQAKREARGI